MEARWPAEVSTEPVAHSWREGVGWQTVPANLGEEIALAIYLDRREVATLMCSPEKLNFLVAGFLRSEGLIDRLDDIAMMRVCDEERMVDVRLTRPRELGEKRILTSGCGGGITFDEGSSLSPVTSGLRIDPGRLLARMRQMLRLCADPAERGGMHLSALSDGEDLLVVARDVGRHNTLDKIWGECLFRTVRPEGRVLLTTGRLSSEMIVKAAKMGVPITVSVNSPTRRAVQLADALGVCAVGYARGTRLSVYSHPERLGDVGEDC
ncbi:MAG: formate dehydrogenase accessory sulfurtransferase FdhD [Chloroflexota bacterium]